MLEAAAKAVGRDISCRSLLSVEGDVVPVLQLLSLTISITHESVVALLGDGKRRKRLVINAIQLYHAS
jgi:hypothetical protein